MSKLDDLFGKKKTIIPVLDLSKTIAHTQEEFKHLMEKVPDFKVRPIKVRIEDIKFKEKCPLFKLTRKQIRKLFKQNGENEKSYKYMNPIPIEMRKIQINELINVPIDWKMLTLIRPKTKLEEDYFSRIVEMGKMKIKTENRDRREQSNGIRRINNKGSIIETRFEICSECNEELCNGENCIKFNYDLFARSNIKAPKLAINKIGNNKLNTKITTINGKIKQTKFQKKIKLKRQRSKSPEKNIN